MSTPPAAPRRWFAFRLSTLVLAVWTIAAGGLIWHRWQPWAVQFVIPDEFQAITDDRRYLITFNSTLTPTIWDTAAVSQARLAHPPQCKIRSFNVCRHHRKLLTVDEDGVARVWDIPTARLEITASIQIFSANETVTRDGHTFSSPTLVIDNGLVLHGKLFQLNTTRDQYRQTTIMAYGDLHFSRDGQFCKSGDTIWNLSTGDVDDACSNWLSEPRQELSSEDARNLFQIDNAVEQWQGRPLPRSYHSRKRQEGRFLADGRYAIDLRSNDGIAICSRLHPKWWWGHFYRPEVWAGIVLAGIWLVKLWRRIFRRTAAA